VKGPNRVLEFTLALRSIRIRSRWREDGLRVVTFSEIGVGRSIGQSLITADRFLMSKKEWRTDGEALISGER
jgi:hypothetical protein